MSAPAPSGTPPASNNTSPPPAATASPPPPAAPVPVSSPPPPQAQAPPPAAPVNPTPPAASPPPDGGSPSPPASPVSPSPPTGGSPPSRGGTPPSVPSPPPPSGGSNTPRSPAPPRTPSTPTPRGPSTPSSENSGGGGDGGGISTTAIIGIAAAGALILLVLAVVLFCMRRKPKRKYRRDEDYESGHYKGGIYDAGRRPSHYGPSHPPPPPPPPPHKHHHAYGSPTPPPPPPPPPPHYSSSGSHDSWTPVPPPPPPRAPSTPSNLGSSKSWFTYEELEEATNGFSRVNLLGEGGFGCVYKGSLPNGKVIAVKQLKVGSGQGEREFRAEVEIISRVHHRHLVSLVGYCIADTQRILVYDFVPNGTLEHHMHGRGRPVMPWPTRLKIAAGAARGLAYLHEDCHPRIIHRDIKSSNILLDNNFEAQVSDFGLAKLASDTYTHVTTRVMGTFGYLAPEYASSGKLTEKSDVYSFGVVLLELITGRKPVDTTQPVGDESLVEWARPYLTQALDDGNLDDLVDRRLGNYNESEMLRMVQAAAACVRHSASKRPRMAQVVRALENEVADLTQGLKPGHSSNFGSSDYDTNQYASDMRKFRKLALGSQEHESGTTSEYGMNPSGSSSEGVMSSTEIDRRRQQGQQQGSDEINVTPGLYGR